MNRRSKAPGGGRRVQLYPLLSGLVFVTVAVLYLLQAGGVLRVNGRVLLPVELIALGVAGLLAAVYTRAPRGAAARRAASFGQSTESSER
ncbi:hypothetical protein [Streptacidiphilus sp. MAP5-3]|uniref:hypothetical protein n=1 Tax=unclassified Streptacidiphilus TaxID=2643834 RepID=UPI0035124F72